MVKIKINFVNSAALSGLRNLPKKNFFSVSPHQLKKFDDYFLNLKTPNDVKEAVALEEKEWNELCEIFKGNKEIAKYGVKAWWT